MTILFYYALFVDACVLPHKKQTLIILARLPFFDVCACVPRRQFAAGNPSMDNAEIHGVVAATARPIVQDLLIVDSYPSKAYLKRG